MSRERRDFPFGRIRLNPRQQLVVLWTIASVLGVHSGIAAARDSRRPAHGFVAYYTSSQILLERDSVNQLYDDDRFRDRVAVFEPTVSDIFWANVPTTAFLAVPLSWMPYSEARLAWTMTNWIILIVVVGWLSRSMKLSRVWLPSMLCYAFLSQPVAENLAHGQMYIAMLALLVIAWSGYSKPSGDLLVSGSLASLLLAKTAALMLWPLLLAERRWRALFLGIAFVLFAVAATLPVVGIPVWREYLTTVASLGDNPALAVTAFQSVPGFVKHLFFFHPQWNPSPLINAPAVGTLLSAIVSLAMFGVTVVVATRRSRSDMVFASFVALGVILSPVSIDYHYSMMLLPIFLLVGVLRDRPLSWSWLLLLTGALLIAADLPYRAAVLGNGLLAILAYPKLYGACIIWVLAVTLAFSSDDDPRQDLVVCPRV